MIRNAENNVNYQLRATEFAVGDVVSVYGECGGSSGRVVAVYPGIGMVDVEYSTGTKRYPVEDLQRFVDGSPVPPLTNSTPGGAIGATTSGGPYAPLTDVERGVAASKVAKTWVKQSLYWAGKDRQYKGTLTEIESGKYLCPKCETELRNAAYKRRDGKSERLLGCPSCLFLVKKSDIMNCPDNAEPCEGEVV